MRIPMSAFAVRRLPKRYKARDAEYATGGNAGMYISARPRKYPMTPQQRKVRDVAKTCNIHHGMSKKELQIAMLCVGEKMRK